MVDLPDHPDIARALLHGYPRRERYCRCVGCGAEYYGGERVYIVDGDVLCDDCLVERLVENYDAADFAHAFGINRVAVSELLTGKEDA